MLLPPIEDYEAFVRDYEREDLDTYNYVDLIDRYAEDEERLALLWTNAEGDECRLTFKDISQASARLAHALQERGVKKGDRILLMFPRSPEWAIAALAGLRIGAVTCSCVTMLQPADLEYRIDKAKPKAVITTAEESGKFEGISDGVDVKIAVGGADGFEDWSEALDGKHAAFENVPLKWDDPASLYFTSGSTGHPKGVVHGAHFAHYLKEVSAYWLDLNHQSKDDLFWCTADTGWALAATGWLVGPWLAGIAVFVHDGPFDPLKRAQLMQQYAVTVFCAPATELRWIINIPLEEFDLSNLRLTVSTGEMLDAPTAARWAQGTGARLNEAFGQTESFMTIANMAGQEIRAGSMGKAVPGFDIEVLDQDSYAVAKPGVVGHIAIKTPTRALLLEYLDDPEKTAEVYKEGPEGRWYVTGDLARRDEDGYFFYEGRADDLINSSGYRIGPSEVEAALMDHPAVLDCAAVGAPDPQRGEVVKAFVILKDDWKARGDGALIPELQNHVKVETAPYKYPRAIEFVDELPRTATGKVRRKTLRDQEYEKFGERHSA
ncbi:MAG: AMP-binding protein [Pseudomonadota bacterium]